MYRWSPTAVGRVWAFSLAYLATASSATAQSVTLNTGGTTAITAGSTTAGLDSDQPTSVPASGTAMGGSGGDVGSATYQLSDGGFDLDFSLDRTPAGAETLALYGIYFSVDEAVDYSIEGWMTAIDAVGESTGLNVRLQEVGGSVLYQNLQLSTSTPDQFFTLDDEATSAGDAQNILTGASTGTLLPATEYLFQVAAELEIDEGSATVGATGAVNLTLGNPTPVPIPPLAVVMIGLGMVGVAVRTTSPTR